MFGVCRDAFVVVLALVLSIARMLGGCRARACMLSCCVLFVCVPVGRYGPLGSLSSWSLFLLFLSFFSFLLLFSLCLSAVPQHLTVNEESMPPEIDCNSIYIIATLFGWISTRWGHCDLVT